MTSPFYFPGSKGLLPKQAPMHLSNTRQIALEAEGIQAAPVSETRVRAIRALLKGNRSGNNRAGPVAVALKALANPHGSTAAVLLAMERGRHFPDYPKNHPARDAVSSLLARACRLLREGQPAECAAEIARLRRLLRADPSGFTAE